MYAVNVHVFLARDYLQWTERKLLIYYKPFQGSILDMVFSVELDCRTWVILAKLFFLPQIRSQFKLVIPDQCDGYFVTPEYNGLRGCRSIADEAVGDL